MTKYPTSMHKAAPTQSTVSRDGTRSKIVPTDVPSELSGVGQTVTVVVKVTADVAETTVVGTLGRDVDDGSTLEVVDDESALEEVLSCGSVVDGK